MAERRFGLIVAIRFALTRLCNSISRDISHDGFVPLTTPVCFQVMYVLDETRKQLKIGDVNGKP